jgi:hypothetical protein
MRSDLSLIADAVRLNKKKRKTHNIGTLLVTLAVCSEAIAGTGAWKLSSDWTGANSGNVSAFLQDPAVPSSIYVSTGSGAGRSADSGNSWPEAFAVAGKTPEAQKLEAPPALTTTLAQLPYVGNVLYAGSSGQGLWRNVKGSVHPNWDTTDSTGATVTPPSPLNRSSWTAVSLPSGTGSGIVTALISHRWQTKIAVAVETQGIYVATNPAVAEKNGAGTLCNVGQYVTAISKYCDPANPDPSWVAVSSPSGLPNAPIATSLAFDPNPGNSNVIYAGIGRTQTWGQAQRTATSGTTTALNDTGANWRTNQWANYYVRVISGTNAGLSRQITSNTNTALTVAAFPAALDNTSAYVIEGQGVFISTNNGASWTPAESGSTAASLIPGSFNVASMIATIQGGNTVLYISTVNADGNGSPAGVYRGVVNLQPAAGHNPSVTWTRLDDGSKQFANVRALAFDPNTPNKIYAGSYGYGVYTATDNGGTGTQTWTDLSTGLTDTNGKYITSLAVDALNPSRLYAGTYGGFYFYATYDDQPKTGLNSSSSTLAFSNITTSQTITLTNNNTGTTPITFDFSKWAIGGNFKYTHGCPTALKPGQSCNVTVTYAPSTYATNENGILTIISDDPSSPTSVTLSGTSAANLTASTTSLAFAQTAVGATSAGQAVVLKNNSLVADVLSFTFSSADFSIDGDCLPTTSTTTTSTSTVITTQVTTTLPAGQSCSLVFAFKPAQAGTKTASVGVNGNGQSYQITLTGGGSGGSTGNGTASVSASLLSFPGVPPYQQSATQTLTLTNTGAQALTVGTISTDNSAFIVDSSACPNSLATNASCKILLAYTPIDGNPATSTLTLQTGAGALTVQLSGTSADITSLTGTAYGSTASRSLIGNFFFSTREQAKTGNLYIAAEVNGQLYFYDGISWFPWLTGAPRPFVSNATYANQTVNILNRMDTTSLRGVPIYLGFGASISDLQKNKTYTPIYVLQ